MKLYSPSVCHTPYPALKVDAIRSALKNAVPELVRTLCGKPNRHMSNRRELRFGTHGSFSIVLSGPKAGCWFDHEAGTGGDAFDLICLRLGMNFQQAKEWAASFIRSDSGIIYPTTITTTAAPANDNCEQYAAQIWAESTDPRGTVVEAYLAKRRLPIPGDIAHSVIRYHGSLRLEGNLTPGMVALMRDIRTNEPCGIHRTFLTPKGTKIEKRMLGRAKGAAIKLSPDEDVTYGLHIGEGIESTLSGMYVELSPAWCLGSANAIATFPVLAGIESLTIFRERDDSTGNLNKANVRASEECTRRWQEVGREVLFATPEHGDLNDVLQAAS